jgi:aconitase B
VKNLAGLWVVVSNDAANGIVALRAEGGVIPFDINWSVIVEYY